MAPQNILEVQSLAESWVIAAITRVAHNDVWTNSLEVVLCGPLHLPLIYLRQSQVLDRQILRIPYFARAAASALEASLIPKLIETSIPNNISTNYLQ